MAMTPNALNPPSLLNYGYEHGYIAHGTFVPTGIHLTVSPDIYKALLCCQNNFLNGVSVFPIEEIIQSSIWQDIEIENTVSTLGEY
eukprot:10948360-Ditylum_brightwellii.AAC.1